MSGPRLACAVRFGLFVPCEAEDHVADEADYVTPVAGAVIACFGPDGRELEPGSDEPGAMEREVGSVRALVIQTRRAFDEGFPLCDVCDAHSGDLEGMFAAVFDLKTEIPKEELETEPCWEGLMYVDAVEADPRYRDRGVGVQAVATTIRTFCWGGVTTARPQGLALTEAEWRELDFVRIAGSDVIVRDGASLSPYRNRHEVEGDGAP